MHTHLCVSLQNATSLRKVANKVAVLKPLLLARLHGRRGCAAPDLGVGHVALHESRRYLAEKLALCLHDIETTKGS
jgi:hypothetical protein